MDPKPGEPDAAVAAGARVVSDPSDSSGQGTGSRSGIRGGRDAGRDDQSGTQRRLAPEGAADAGLETTTEHAGSDNKATRGRAADDSGKRRTEAEEGGTALLRQSVTAQAVRGRRAEPSKAERR